MKLDLNFKLNFYCTSPLAWLTKNLTSDSYSFNFLAKTNLNFSFDQSENINLNFYISPDYPLKNSKIVFYLKLIWRSFIEHKVNLLAQWNFFSSNTQNSIYLYPDLSVGAIVNNSTVYAAPDEDSIAFAIPVINLSKSYRIESDEFVDRNVFASVDKFSNYSSIIMHDKENESLIYPSYLSIPTNRLSIVAYSSIPMNRSSIPTDRSSLILYLPVPANQLSVLTNRSSRTRSLMNRLMNRPSTNRFSILTNRLINRSSTNRLINRSSTNRLINRSSTNRLSILTNRSSIPANRFSIPANRFSIPTNILSMPTNKQTDRFSMPTNRSSIPTNRLSISRNKKKSLIFGIDEKNESSTYLKTDKEKESSTYLKTDKEKESSKCSLIPTNNSVHKRIYSSSDYNNLSFNFSHILVLSFFVSVFLIRLFIRNIKK